MGGSMMKKESLILLLSVYTCLLFAVPADMTPQYVVMANGDSILVVLHGDEYVSWYETDEWLASFAAARNNDR